jgi:hypothetical protein
VYKARRVGVTSCTHIAGLFSLFQQLIITGPCPPGGTDIPFSERRSYVPCIASQNIEAEYKLM